MRPVVYQLFVRHFGNSTTSGKEWGTKEINGCGRFVDITEVALRELKQLGVTHIWLTGILRHATQTNYEGFPGQRSGIVKGLAGSPYAVVDYFDLDFDLAQDVKNRFEEFSKLIKRCHDLGFKVLMDFIPNHVSRAFRVPEGLNEEKRDVFFDKGNLFYHLDKDSLGQPPFQLPVHKEENGGWHGRVTGNNCNSWQPSEFDWYETVKLNYGVDYRRLEDMQNLPDLGTPVEKTPICWQLMDQVIHFWQSWGIDGFRCDMAHMVPMKFWAWLIDRAVGRKADVLFLGEAYDDGMKTTYGDPLPELLRAGFHSVYASVPYHLIKGIYEGEKWANDLDGAMNNDEISYHRSVRYVENHDEVRLGAEGKWGGVGLDAAISISGVIWYMGGGAILLYNGQEVGEKADGFGGFGGHDGKTSIFDYTQLPTLQGWANENRYDGAKLSLKSQELRVRYANLLSLAQHPALVSGQTYGLNWANRFNPAYGRGLGEIANGHWIYSFLRHDFATRRTVFVVANLHPKIYQHGLRIILPYHALHWAELEERRISLKLLIRPMHLQKKVEVGEVFDISAETLSQHGFLMELPPGEIAIFELE